VSGELSVGIERPGEDVLDVPIAREDVEGRVRTMASTPSARFADFFGSVEDGQLTIRLVWALDQGGRYVVFRWPARGTGYPPVSNVAPGAYVEECEIYEQFGVMPGEGKTLNRLVIPPHAERDFPRLGEAPPKELPLPHAPYYVSGEAIEFPVGPVRGVGQESLYIGLVTSGEEVIDLYLLQWHKHRGIERRLRGLRPERAVFFVERLEGLSAVGNAWAFCNALERIANVTPAPDVERSRGVALELERMYNHIGAIAALCQATGLAVGQAQVEILLDELLRLNAAAFGHRYLFGILAPGGVTRAPERDAITAGLPRILGDVRRLLDSLWATNSFVDRLESCGVVTADQATRLGLVGPVARASGVDIDTRRDHPFGAYQDVGSDVALRSKGDVMSRMSVMASEIDESARVVDRLLELGVGGGAPELPTAPGSALGWCESARGESLAWVAVDRNGCILRARLRPASVRNWRAFDDAARSRNVFTDIPIVEASFWLTVAGLAR
jgi:Ni,Fe-hydrogenase III large subunit